MKKDIKWYVYEPVKWKRELGYKVDMDRCRYQVNHDRYGFAQCCRKPKRLIEGYGFCEQHAKMVERGLADRIPF